MKSAATTLHVVVRSPLACVLETEARHVTAEDSSGRFGISLGTEPMVTALLPSIVTVREADGRERFIAAGAGLLHAERDSVTLAVRHATLCASLEEVRTALAQTEQEARAGERAVREAMRQLMRQMGVTLARQGRVP